MSDYRDSTPLFFAPPWRKRKKQEIDCDHIGTKKVFTVAAGYKCERCGRELDAEKRK